MYTSLSSAEIKRLLLILNPVSGRRKGRKFFPEIIRTFTSAGYQVTAYVTGAAGDARSYVVQHGGSFDLIVCIGGDGTLNEIVSGITEAGHTTAVGYIPSGSTNDFASSHGLSSNILAAARDIVSGSPALLDIGKFNSRYFTYIAAFGAFSWLSYSTPQNLKNILGHKAYILDGIKDISMIRPECLSFQIDGKVFEGNFLFGAICNSTRIAGTFSLPSELVDPSDGMFEVFLIRSPATIAELQLILSALLSHDYSACPHIQFLKADKISVKSSHGAVWTLDGEFAGSPSQIEINNLHKSLKIFINK